MEKADLLIVIGEKWEVTFLPFEIKKIVKAAITRRCSIR